MISMRPDYPASASRRIGAGFGQGVMVATTGVLVALGFGPLYGAWWPGFIALVPWLLATRGAGGRRGALLGLACGVVMWACSTWWVAVGLWVWNSMEPWRAIVSALPMFFYQAIPYAVFGWWYGRATRKKPEQAASSEPGALRIVMLLTLLVGWFPTVVPGSWANLFSSMPRMIQLLELGGDPLLLFMTALINVLVVRGIERLPNLKQSGFCVGAAALVAAFMWSYGAVRMPMVSQVDQQRIEKGEKPVHLALVQPDLPIKGYNAVYFTGPDARVRTLDDVAGQVRSAAASGPAAVILPELPVWVECSDRDTDMAKLYNATREQHVGLVVSCGSFGNATDGYYNCAATARPESGFDQGIYRKRMLVPFGEYVPFEKDLPFLRDLIPGAKRYLSGGGSMVLEAGNIRLAPLLCYEVHFSRLAREQRLAGADVLVNLSDIAWFGRTEVTALHEALARHRAIEMRMPLLLVGNSGPTMAMDSTGRTVPGTRLPLFEPGVAHADVLPAGPPSFYARHGDIFLHALTVLVVCGWVVRRIYAIRHRL